MQELSPISADDSGWLPAVRWMSLLRGGVALVFGALALGGSLESAQNLLVVVGIYLLADGSLAVLEGLERVVHSGRPFGPYVFEGVVSIAAGVLALTGSRYVGLAFLALAVRCIATGAAEFSAGRQICRETGKAARWSTGMAGVASLVVGVGLIAEPAVDVRLKVSLLGLYGLAFGAALLGMFAETRFDARERAERAS